MSFGFALGDFLAVINLADRLRKDWLDAPEEYKAICVRLGQRALEIPATDSKL